MEKSRYVTYTQNDKEIVKEGIVSIQKVLLGEDMDKKRSLLFCLDWYMDPPHIELTLSVDKNIMYVDEM